MNTVEATYLQMSTRFGQHLNRGENPVEKAAEWLIRTLRLAAEFQHGEVLIQSCKAPVLEPIGVKRIDAMMADSGDFMSGNVASNVQSSQILPAYSKVEVNGFTELEGCPIVSGWLRAKAFQRFLDTPWSDGADRQALREIEACLNSRTVRPDEQTTVMRVMHMRTKQTRYRQLSPVITHGWLLIGERGQIHFEKQTNASDVSGRMMARAKALLSCERYEPVDLLRIEGGKTVFVADSVLRRIEALGHDLSEFDLSHVPATTPDADENKSAPRG